MTLQDLDFIPPYILEKLEQDNMPWEAAPYIHPLVKQRIRDAISPKECEVVKPAPLTYGIASAALNSFDRPDNTYIPYSLRQTYHPSSYHTVLERQYVSYPASIIDNMTLNAALKAQQTEIAKQIISSMSPCPAPSYMTSMPDSLRNAYRAGTWEAFQDGVL